MSHVFRVAVFLAILSVVPARAWAQDAATQVQQASAAYARQDYAEAARLFRLAADAGNVDGQHYLGHMYQRGLGVPEDHQQALKLLKRAADAGHADAQNDVGNIHFNGHSDLESVSQRLAEAAKYYRMSAAQGFAQAQRMLGIMYYNGLGMARDETEARRFLGLAAAQGNADARSALVSMDSIAQAVVARSVLERSGPVFMYASGRRRYRMDITQRFRCGSSACGGGAGSGWLRSCGPAEACGRSARSAAEARRRTTID